MGPGALKPELLIVGDLGRCSSQRPSGNLSGIVILHFSSIFVRPVGNPEREPGLREREDYCRKEGQLPGFNTGRSLGIW